jgi:ribosomal protein S27E
MKDADLRLDGNAVAGLLSELFVYEMTSARSTCANCGAVGEVGTLLVYVHAPGTVIRCPRCNAVLMRIVRGADRYWIEAQGVRCLELGEPPGAGHPR